MADIKKLFTNYCSNTECNKCPYDDSGDCLRDYILDLFNKVNKETEDEE